MTKVKDRFGLSYSAQALAEEYIGLYIGRFIEPIVNRTLRLGIGKSLLSKKIYTPMLAKKYEGNILSSPVYITEKLDGNRCIAYYDDDQQKWCYKSRSGKSMNVDFDMSALPKEFIYDGEVMSTAQTQASLDRTEHLLKYTEPSSHKKYSQFDAQLDFNKTSGLINQKGTKKNLVYNIFDIISPVSYTERRVYLNTLPDFPTSNTRIVPILDITNDTDTINRMLDIICDMGGEGLMLNIANAPYENKRSSALLKYKQVQHCDMLVIDIFEGKGKYEGMCGGITCRLVTEDGKDITCDVGSGLSDVQRRLWWENPQLIVGHIVEIAYHELTQDRNNRGTNKYSLRFPRFKRTRPDKNLTSLY